MYKLWLKTCSIVLVLALFVNMLPMYVFAQEFQQAVVAAEQEIPAGTVAEEAYIVKEITENRTEFSKEFQLSNGLRMAAVYANAVHYETENGWEEIDNTLITRTDGTYTNTAGVWNVSLPQQLSKANGVTIEKDGYTLSFYMSGELRSAGDVVARATPEGTAEASAAQGTTAEPFAVSDAQQATAVVQPIDRSAMLESVQYEEMVPDKTRSRLSYNNVFTNTNIVYDLDSNKVKESIILKAYSQTLRGYRYTLQTGEMIPVLESSGEILFYDKTQENVVMVMPAPYLVDNAGEYNNDIQVQLAGSNGTYTLTYTLPQQWLAAEDRVWPVILDPTIMPELTVSNIYDQTVSQKRNLSHTWGMLDAGYSGVDGITRFFIQYKNLPAITSSDVVVNAYIQLGKPENSGTTASVEVHKVNDTWESSTISWANKPAYNENIEDYAIVKNAGYYHWVITDLVRDWYTGQNTGMMFKVSDEVETAQVNNYKQFCSSDFAENDAFQPVLCIYFLNNNGLEGYWDYTSASAGRAGTGYVNNYTGNMTFVRSDIGFGGNLMPVSISHVYNLNDAITVTDNNNSNDTSGNAFGMGLGWRTNYNQLVYQWSENDDYYVWEDEDGTDHYFEYSSANTYEAEGGLELTLKTNGSGDTKYSITDKKGNVSYFDTYGRLTKLSNNQETQSHINITYTTTSGKLISTITDGAGRKYMFTYTNGLCSRISYHGDCSSQEIISYLDFTYENTKLIRITDADSANCNYTYTAQGLLQSAEDVDGYKLNYTYSTGRESWQPYRTLSVKETYQPATGAAVEGGELTFSYGHNQTTIADHNGNVQMLQFNDMGNTISIQDDEGHAQYAQFAKNSADDTGKGNQLTAASKLQNTVGNRLIYSSFEGGNIWQTNFAELTADCSTEAAYVGSHSLKIVSSAATMQSVFVDSLNVAPGETYTFSAYVKTGSTSAAIGLFCHNDSIIYGNDELPVNNDWTRLQVSYTNKLNVSQTITPKLYIANAGTVFMDCVQLEKSSSASRFNLLDNGDFVETGDAPTSWTRASSLSSSDTCVADTAAAPTLNANVYRITGHPTTLKHISQDVTVSGGEGDSFVFAAWAKGNSAPLDYDNDREREFAVRAKFYYTDDTESEYFTARFNPDSNEWQYTAGAMVAEKAYSGIQLQLAYDYNVNTVLFDGAQLYKEEFGSSYTYDEDGNVISVTDLQAQTTTYEYDTSNNLTHIIQNGNTKMTYTYDDYHNVKTATTDEQITYSFVYDEYGNNTSVSITDAENESAITSSAAYSEDGNRLESTTDAVGKTTYYGYDANTNVLLWVKYPGDTETTKTNYEYEDPLFRMTSVAANTDTGLAMSADYTYTNGQLSAIETPSTTYEFTYGNFGLRTSVEAGGNLLATYSYTTDRNNYLASIDYGNLDSVEYEYDDKGRVTSETYENGDTVTYTYDNNGALAQVTDSATGITTTYYYDFIDRMMKYVESSSGLTHSVGYEYDDLNNLTRLVETINGVSHTTEYTYDDDNRVTSVTNGNTSVTYTYDAYGRTTQQVVSHDDNTQVTNTYSYSSVNGKPTTRISHIKHTIGDNAISLSSDYTFHEDGNIKEFTYGPYSFVYTYDSADQLIREDNPIARKSWVWTYDNAGNILSRKEYAYTTGDLGAVLNTVTYNYDDGEWKDLLIGYNGKTITYDTIGNPLSDGTWTYEWQHGRQLKSMTQGTTTWTYTYDANGMRTSRSNGTDSYTYVYNGSQLAQMTKGDDTLYFTYDANGIPIAVTHDNGTTTATYYYVTNLQGDVMHIFNTNGSVVGNYFYDAWGNVISSGTSTICQLNPLRYRGYVYDSETKLYYLQSRYYNPEVGRFINADNPSYLGSDGITSYNLFSYCGNNPVMGYDPTGCWNWGLFADIAITLATTVIAVAVGISVGISTYSATGSVGTSVGAGVAAGVATFGAINNTVNAVYYNHISDGEAEIETNPDYSTYVDEYVTRWDRLDYTKQETQESTYNFDAWAYHSEYSLHMYGWYATSWAHDNPNSPLFNVADKFYRANVTPHVMDERFIGKVGTVIWGLFGL